MQYIPIALPFFLAFWLLFGLVIVLIQIGILQYVFESMGVSRRHMFGLLVGADLLNLGRIRGLGAPVASIGGAGKFDGIFLAGIVAVLLAGILGGRPRTPRREWRGW